MSEQPEDDLSRCAVCGWSLEKTVDAGCVRGNCSLRPLPTTFYSPARARAEYAPYLDHDPRAAVRAHRDKQQIVSALNLKYHATLSVEMVEIAVTCRFTTWAALELDAKCHQ